MQMNAENQCSVVPSDSKVALSFPYRCVPHRLSHTANISMFLQKPPEWPLEIFQCKSRTPNACCKNNIVFIHQISFLINPVLDKRFLLNFFWCCQRVAFLTSIHSVVIATIIGFASLSFPVRTILQAHRSSADCFEWTVGFKTVVPEDGSACRRV